jgi:hypothetical protein
MMNIFIFTFYLLFFDPPFVMAQTAEAWIEPRFGPEFTFDTEDTNIDYELVLNRMYAHLVLGQPDGEKFERPFPNRFVSPDGWYFILTTDGSVLEVQMKPMTVDEYKAHAVNIQDAVFVSAANERSFPALYKGGGHINIGLKELEHDPLLVRNFIVDYINHAELAMGIMNYDTHNALPVNLIREEQGEHLNNLIQNYDAIPESEKNLLHLYALLSNIRAVIGGGANHNDDFCASWGTFCRGKMTSIAFVNAKAGSPESSRLEIRAVRPQKDINTFNHQISLFRSRLKYLKTIRHPIPLKLEVRITNPIQPYSVHKLTPPIDAQEALRAFYRYVTESGELWKNHRNYIWPQWIWDGELKKFEASRWFKEKARTCVSLLK